MSKRLTKEEFIIKARAIHGNKYDYTNSVYETAIKPIEIFCPKHGIFEQSSIKHIHLKRGCPKCGYDSRKIKAKINFVQINKDFSILDFLEKAKSIHGDLYDYSLVEYKNSRTKIDIICPKHGIFKILSNHHLQGQICPKCSSENRMLSTEEFIEKAKLIHNNLYDYLKVKCDGYHTKVKIKCKSHGIFEQTPANHLTDHGCPYCAIDLCSSKEEIEVYNWVKRVYDGKIITNDRELLEGKEVDIYFPDKNFAIEYNGLYWHTDDKVDKLFHYQKSKQCELSGISLFHIFSDDWVFKNNIIKSMIKYRLGIIDNKIYARKCTISKIDPKIGKEFFEKNHLQGSTISTEYYGLYYQDELVSCLSLRKPFHKKYNEYIEIARFASKIDNAVIGGFQKLLKIIKNKYKKIITYADLNTGTGNTYELSGFELLGITQPNFWYTDGRIRENRFKYRASNGTTEKEVANQNNVKKIYGVGSKIFIINGNKNITNNKLVWKDINNIRNNQTNFSNKELSKQHCVSQETIRLIRLNKIWIDSCYTPKITSNNKLFNEDIKNIFQLKKDGLSQTKIAEKFNITQSMVSKILNKKRY